MNAVFVQQALEPAAIIVAVAILLWQSYLDKRDSKGLNLYLLGIAYSLVIASIFALFFNHIASVPLIFGVAIASCTSVYQYARHRLGFSISVLYIFIIISYLYTISSVLLVIVAAQSMSIGLIAAFLALRRSKMASKQARDNPHVEIRRDIFEIVMGLILFAIIMLVRYYLAIYIVVVLSLLGYSVSGLARKNGKLYSMLSTLEREGTMLGEGAVYLAVGTLLMVSFIHSHSFLITGIIALYFSDSLGTIIGVRYGKHKLPYNRRKSIEGTTAFFASAAILAFPFIGVYSIAVAAVLALIESASGAHNIDDNVSIAIGTIAIYAIALLVV